MKMHPCVGAALIKFARPVKGAQEVSAASTCPSSLQQQGSDWSRKFNYDPYGNMWVTNPTGIATTGQTPNANIFTTGNRITGVSYDGAGNQVSLNGVSLNDEVATYDAENRQAGIQQTQPNVATESYLYDGDGHRVEKVGPDGSAVIYVYDAMGDLAAEYSSYAPSAGPCTTSPCMIICRSVKKSVSASVDESGPGEQVLTTSIKSSPAKNAIKNRGWTTSGLGTTVRVQADLCRPIGRRSPIPFLTPSSTTPRLSTCTHMSGTIL